MLLSISNLEKDFWVRSGLGKPLTKVEVLKGINLTVAKGEIVGILGDSGSGKSTLAKIILRLLPPSSGKITYAGQDIFGFSKQETSLWRKKVQIVLQNPFRSLPPRRRVADILREVIHYHHVKNRAEEKDYIAQLLRLVGLTAADGSKFPFQFSGGERQRVAIARSLAVNPEFLILDEPTSNLDLSIQAQVINVLTELRQRLNLTYLFISHDRNLAAYFCDRLLEMKEGNLYPLN
ncbi:MAG: dipeptide/oligopeptide/nickel ABC transporter ATP-binding protein [Candidatus Ratteibacteria bacterium]|jgi:ABC-type oligopeptide transport system ATPase subunit